MRGFLEWLGTTQWSISLLESLYAWTVIEAIHVLTLGLFVGTAIINDVRLLGWGMRQVPVSEVTGRLLPITRLGFAIMVTTGLLLFYANPLRYYHSIFFRLKVVLLIVAGLNALAFHRGIHRRVADWDLDPVLPREARIAGAISLAAWALIVVCGRLIAYDLSWFDCSLQPQPGWVNWAAGCVIEP